MSTIGRAIIARANELDLAHEAGANDVECRCLGSDHPAAVEATEHGALREREAVLRAQPADQMPEHEPQPARQQCRVDLRCHITTISK